jgi:hypothetical protein
MHAYTVHHNLDFENLFHGYVGVGKCVGAHELDPVLGGGFCVGLHTIGGVHQIRAFDGTGKLGISHDFPSQFHVTKCGCWDGTGMGNEFWDSRFFSKQYFFANQKFFISQGSNLFL